MVQIIPDCIFQKVLFPCVIDEFSLLDDDFCDGQQEKTYRISLGKRPPRDRCIEPDQLRLHRFLIGISKDHILQIIQCH